MDLIIFANPNSDSSHGAAVLKHVTQKLKHAGKKFEVLDLYKENFDPVLRYDKTDPNVAKYQEMMKNANRYIFIYPIWWYTTPAILKGFIDKVLTAGFAFNYGPDGRPVGHLKDKKAIVINTFGGPKEEIAMTSDAMANTFHKGTLSYCGITHVHRVDWFGARKQNEPLPAEVAAQIDKSLELDASG